MFELSSLTRLLGSLKSKMVPAGGMLGSPAVLPKTSLQPAEANCGSRIAQSDSTAVARTGHWCHPDHPPAIIQKRWNERIAPRAVPRGFLSRSGWIPTQLSCILRSNRRPTAGRALTKMFIVTNGSPARVLMLFGSRSRDDTANP